MSKLKQIIINIAKKNQMLRTFIRKVAKISKSILYKYYQNTIKVQKDTILFSSFMGRQYACSPKAIYEEMKRDQNFSGYKFIWAFKDPNKIVDGAVVVQYGSKEYMQYCCKAKHIVDNSRLPDYISLKNEQIFTQCWHGTPLKRLGYDIEIDGGNALNSKSDLRAKYKSDAQKYSNLLSPSKYTTDKLTSAFNLAENNPSINIIEEGYPRNDILVDFNDDDVDEIKEVLNIPKDKKVILYAPTWRDNQHQSGVGYTYELGLNFSKLQEELGSEYIILFRAHYFIANKFNFDQYKDFIFDVSGYDDISELYIISDILITDYSSVFFDYAVLKRKIIFYMYDLEQYQSGIRDFYISLEELPGEIIASESQLIENIREEYNYDVKYEEFNKKYNYLEDGNASRRVIDIVFRDEE